MIALLTIAKVLPRQGSFDSRGRRRGPAAALRRGGESGLTVVRFRFLGLVFDGLVAAKLPPIQLGPFAIQVSVRLPIEMEFVILSVSRLEMDVVVGVLGVLVNSRGCTRSGKRAFQVVVCHGSRFVGWDAFFEGENDSVMRARGALATTAGPCELVLLLLAGVFLQVFA
jgi:hypothetical protein